MAVTGEQGERLERLESEVDRLRSRVAHLERWAPMAAPPPRPEAVHRAADRAGDAGPEAVHRAADRAGGAEPGRASREATGAHPRSDSTRPQQREALEDWLGGRVLGLAGGIAVLLGVAFLFATAIERGWLGEGARVFLGFSGSGLLLLAGLWLHERRGHTQAARAASAAGIAGMLASIVAASRLYELIPLPIALVFALAIGGVAVALAVHWESLTIGSLGIVGGLLAPVLIGADSSGATVALTLVTLGAASSVVAWQRWTGLGLAAFAVALPQVAAWVATGPTAETLVAGLVVTWALGTAAAVALSVRADGDEPDIGALVLLAGSAVFAVAAGNLALRSLGLETAGSLWVVAVAAGQLGAGAAIRHWAPGNRELATMSFGASIAAADLALILIADGAVVTVGFAAAAIGSALLARVSSRRGNERDAAHAGIVLAVELGLAIVHALAIDAPPDALVNGVDDMLAATLGLCCVAGCALRAARVAPVDARERVALQAVAATALMHLVSVGIVTAFQAENQLITSDLTLLSVEQQGQLLLSAFWGVTGVAALVLGLRRGEAHVRWGGFGLLGAATAKVFLFDLSALDSLYRVGSFVALGLLLLAGAFAYQRLRASEPREQIAA